ncbi:hypothetical protein [Variovorax paradoxus]|uniref:hypothetical protein n=1 Tax=Variovorax paradoxus TaxID=34073 RepID=UPI002480D7C6|nr:hypothetical protein [Variovorax paradoxus]WGT63289.1 hypothetical protein QHG62_25185 [Variovorax paradoxus]
MAKTMTLYPVNPPAFTSKQKSSDKNRRNSRALPLSYGLATGGIRTRDPER